MTQPPDFHTFFLYNDDGADTIFPVLFDEGGNPIWKGSDHNFLVSPGKSLPLDLNNIPDGPSSQSVLILGCGVLNKAPSYKDSANKRTYINSSQNVAPGHYKAGKFTVVPATQLSLDAAAALQEAYAKLNSASVAKFLVAVAGLISPELV